MGAAEWNGPGPRPEFGPSPGFRNLKWLKPVYAGETVRYTRTCARPPRAGVAAGLARAVDARRRLRFDRRQGDRVRQRRAGESRVDSQSNSAPLEEIVCGNVRLHLARPSLVRATRSLPTIERNSHAICPSLLSRAPTSLPPAAIPKLHETFWASFIPYMKALHDAGIVVAGAGLQQPERRRRSG